MRLTVATCVLIAIAGGCGGGPDRSPDRPHADRSESPPAADAPLPGSTSGLAPALADTTRNLEASIRVWLRTHPGAAGRPSQEVGLYALYQQRIYRQLRRHPALAERVIAALPARLRSQARDNVTAGRSLLRLAPKKPPKTQPPIRTGSAEPPGRLLGWYRHAQRRFGVRWQILAAVNLVESGFNRLRNNSYAGAQGPMQFVPATWRVYGLGGDVRDPHDAIMGAANYLHASGAPASYKRALYAYNPSPLYVDAILRYARQMQRRTERFYAYWSWQVFVRDNRLTGPGL
jgi:soluble lytic murein transglycosylase-like protein